MTKAEMHESLDSLLKARRCLEDAREIAARAIDGLDGRRDETADDLWTRANSMANDVDDVAGWMKNVLDKCTAMDRAVAGLRAKRLGVPDDLCCCAKCRFFEPPHKCNRPKENGRDPIDTDVFDVCVKWDLKKEDRDGH